MSDDPIFAIIKAHEEAHAASLKAFEAAITDPGKEAEEHKLATAKMAVLAAQKIYDTTPKTAAGDNAKLGYFPQRSARSRTPLEELHEEFLRSIFGLTLRESGYVP
jgi:hypothetical protein